METFKKIKKYNLYSMDADNVDYDTPKNKAIQLSNFDENNVYSTLKFRSEAFRKMQAIVYRFKDAQKAVFILVCTYSSHVFTNHEFSICDCFQRKICLFDKKNDVYIGIFK